MDDRSLAAAAAGGDREAFAALVEHYRRYIYAIAYKISLHEEDALDITQNVMLALVRKIGLYRGDGPFRSWLAAVAAHEALNFVRRRSRRVEAPTDPADLDKLTAARGNPSAAHADPREAAEHAQRRRLVEEAVAGLSPQQRAIFLLRFREEMWPREIAERLGLPAKQVRSQLHRALARLRDAVARKERTGAGPKGKK